MHAPVYTIRDLDNIRLAIYDLMHGEHRIASGPAEFQSRHEFICTGIARLQREKYSYGSPMYKACEMLKSEINRRITGRAVASGTLNNWVLNYLISNGMSHGDANILTHEQDDEFQKYRLAWLQSLLTEFNHRAREMHRDLRVAELLTLG